MANRRVTFVLLGAVMAFVLAVAPTALAAALNGEDDATNNAGSGTPKTEDSTRHASNSTNSTAENKTEPSEGADDTIHPLAKQTIEHRLENAKLRVCRNHEANISKLMTNGVQRAQKQIDLFTTITTRVEAFYTEKGKTVDSYDRLVAAVGAAKATAATDLSTLQGTSTFSCDGSDPKGTASGYRSAAEKLRQDLQAYRTAIKNLIVAVKAAQGDA
jgi:hypothetical protein